MHLLVLKGQSWTTDRDSAPRQAHRRLVEMASFTGTLPSYHAAADMAKPTQTLLTAHRRLVERTSFTGPLPSYHAPPDGMANEEDEINVPITLSVFRDKAWPSQRRRF